MSVWHKTSFAGINYGCIDAAVYDSSALKGTRKSLLPRHDGVSY